MNFTINKQDLLEHLNIITPLISRNSIKPILECLRIDLKGNKLNLTATDLSVTLLSDIIVNGKIDGFCLIEAKRLLSIVKKLPSKDIEIKKEDNKVRISSGKAKFDISISENYNDFPRIPQTLTKNSFKINSIDFANYISKTVKSVSTDELRAVLTGVLFSLNEYGLTMVSTDSVKLVKIYKEGIICGENKHTDIIIPTKALFLINNSIDENFNIDLFYEENYIQAKIGDITIFSRVINGKYPAYQAIIPLNNDIKIVLDRQNLINIIDRVSLACNPLTRLVKVVFEEGKVTVMAEDSSSSSKAEETENINYSGETLSIGFNSTKLLDLLKTIDSKDVLFEISSSSRPVLIMPVKDENSFNMLSLIMPVKIK